MDVCHSFGDIPRNKSKLLITPPSSLCEQRGQKPRPHGQFSDQNSSTRSYPRASPMLDWSRRLGSSNCWDLATSEGGGQRGIRTFGPHQPALCTSNTAGQNLSPRFCCTICRMNIIMMKPST
ncbi:hypothetical protein V2G26_011701 [Clonostachys chloroleuca]